MYVKVQELVYSALETMVTQHADFFIALDPGSGMFGQLLRIFLRGLQVKGISPHPTLISSSFNTPT